MRLVEQISDRTVHHYLAWNPDIVIIPVRSNWPTPPNNHYPCPSLHQYHRLKTNPNARKNCITIKIQAITRAGYQVRPERQNACSSSLIYRGLVMDFLEPLLEPFSTFFLSNFSSTARALRYSFMSFLYCRGVFSAMPDLST